MVHRFLLSLLALLPLAGFADEPRDVAAPGAALVALLEARDAGGLTAQIDRDFLLERVLEGSSLAGVQRRNFAKGFGEGQSKAGANLLSNLDRSRATVRLVRSTALGAGTTQIIRLDFHDAEGTIAGFDYLEFELGPDGRIRDWRSHAQGSRASDTMRLLVSSSFDDRTVAGWLFGRSVADEALLAHIKAFSAALARGDFRAAYTALAGFPPDFRKSRQWAGLRVAMAANLDDATYRSELAAMARDHGTDPQVQFMLVDHFFFTRDYARMVEAVRRFEERVVADGATNLLECNGYTLMEKWPEAERACREANRVEPSFTSAWWSLVDVYAGARDAGRLVATLDEIEAKFELRPSPDALLAIEGYEWLAKDPAFAAWASEHR